jgi:hypothetical protein
MVNRNPRQTVGFDVAFDGTEAKYYCTDGYVGYVDVVYPGKHIYNPHNKNDTFTVESINADLRHYIPVLARKSKCFPRSLNTLKAVLDVFVDAYNRFGIAKYKYRLKHKLGEIPFALVSFI